MGPWPNRTLAARRGACGRHASRSQALPDGPGAFLLVAREVPRRILVANLCTLGALGHAQSQDATSCGWQGLLRVARAESREGRAAPLVRAGLWTLATGQASQWFLDQPSE
eukprot:2646590-Prymnesium_polylepis.1